MAAWRILAHSSDIAEGKAKRFEDERGSLFVVHKHGSFYAYRNACPHLGIALEWQPDSFLDYDGELIQCASHGALFKINDGECLSGPCIGQRLEALALKHEQGKLWLRV